VKKQKTSNKIGKSHRRTSWRFLWKSSNGHFKVGEVFGDPPEKVRIQIINERVHVDIGVTKDEALAITYGINRVLFRMATMEPILR